MQSASAVQPDLTDLESRFKTLVQSPLRAGLLRYLAARPDEPSLHAALGRALLRTGKPREAIDSLERLILGKPRGSAPR